MAVNTRLSPLDTVTDADQTVDNSGDVVATPPLQTTPVAPPPATDAGNISTGATAPSFNDLLAKDLGITTSQLGQSSGKGAYGDWYASITPEQYQELVNAGYDPNAATSGKRGMQEISYAGDPTTGGLSIVPQYAVIDTGEGAQGFDTSKITGYDVYSQANLGGANLAAAQAAAHKDFDPTSMFINIALSAAGVPAWALSATNAAYAISQGESVGDALKNAAISYGINTAVSGLDKASADSVSKTIGNTVGMSQDQIDSLSSTLKGGLASPATKTIESGIKDTIDSVAGNPLGTTTISKTTDKLISGAIKGGLSAAIKGQDIETGAVMGLTNAGVNSAVNAVKQGAPSAWQDVKNAWNDATSGSNDSGSSGNTPGGLAEGLAGPPVINSDGSIDYPDGSYRSSSGILYDKDGHPISSASVEAGVDTGEKVTVSAPSGTEDTSGLPAVGTTTKSPLDTTPSANKVVVTAPKPPEDLTPDLSNYTPVNPVNVDLGGQKPPVIEVTAPKPPNDLTPDLSNYTPVNPVNVDLGGQKPPVIEVTAPKPPDDLTPHLTDPNVKIPSTTIPADTGTNIKIPAVSSSTSGSTTDGLTSGLSSVGIPWLDTSPNMLYNMANLASLRLAQHEREAKKKMAQKESPLDEVTNPVDHEAESPRGYASGGSSTMDVIKEFTDAVTPKFANTGPSFLQSVASPNRKPIQLTPLQQISQLSSRTIGGMAEGGLPKKYRDAMPDGHKPEFITGITGYYASGGGTGQSDDIDAMLHDGDYVMDAETVSALGDGSSKAGREVLEGFQSKVPHRATTEGRVVPAKIADGEYVFPAAFVTALGRGDNKQGAKILDGLREKLREHKRSAPSTKIPPKAKAPLDYIKMAKG